MRELFPSENPDPSKKLSEKLPPHTLEAKKIWGYICEELHSQLGEEICKKWIFPIHAKASNEDELILVVPTIHFYQIILSEYLEIIERCKNKLGFEHVSTVIDLDRSQASNNSKQTPHTFENPKDRGSDRAKAHKRTKIPLPHEITFEKQGLSAPRIENNLRGNTSSFLTNSHTDFQMPKSEFPLLQNVPFLSSSNFNQNTVEKLSTPSDKAEISIFAENKVENKNEFKHGFEIENHQEHENKNEHDESVYHGNTMLFPDDFNNNQLKKTSLDLTQNSNQTHFQIDADLKQNNINDFNNTYEAVALGKIEPLESHESKDSHHDRSNSDALFSNSLSRKTKLNPTYTFENFVRGPSNQFALAACYNVAENPGKTYNPLFIYGATGLGKTHLLHAVGNHIVKTNPNSTVAYISSERFMNELIYCLRHNKITEFRQKYRHCDLFLMDDIQFISGNKAATQEEFFHTFNTLYEAKKQIIITSDLFPQDIPDIEERLRNRFQWGLIADIQPPDVEHRIAILYSKAEQLGIRLSLDVAEYIANFVKRNVRELEGALHRLDAFATLHGKPLDKSLAIETFSNMLSEDTSKSHMLIDTVQKVVAEHFQIKTQELKSKRRHKALTLPRQVAMYLARKFTKTSYPEIGEKFGGKDHTTVIHAVRKITQERKKNMDLLVHLEALERIIERLH